MIGAGHAGVEAAYAAARLGCSVGLCTLVARHCRAHAVQSRSRWHGEGPLGPRNRCAWRADGAGHRRDWHSVQAPQPKPRPCRLVAPRAGGQAAVRRVGHRERWNARAGNLVAVSARPLRLDVEHGRIAGLVMEGGERYGCGALVVTTGNVSERTYPHWCGTASGRTARGAGVARSRGVDPRHSGLKGGRLKTGYSASTTARLGGFRARGPHRALRRKSGVMRFLLPFSFLTQAPPRNQIRCWLLHTTRSYVHAHRAAAHRSQPAVQRPDPGDRSALLSFAGRQDHAVSRAGTSPDLPRAGRARRRRNLREWVFDVAAPRRSGAVGARVARP